MADHDKKRENATSILLLFKRGCDVNPTTNGSSGVDLSLHFISTPHSSVVVGYVIAKYMSVHT